MTVKELKEFLEKNENLPNESIVIITIDGGFIEHVYADIDILNNRLVVSFNGVIK